MIHSDSEKGAFTAEIVRPTTTCGRRVLMAAAKAAGKVRIEAQATTWMADGSSDSTCSGAGTQPELQTPWYHCLHRVMHG